MLAATTNTAAMSTNRMMTGRLPWSIAWDTTGVSPDRSAWRRMTRCSGSPLARAVLMLVELQEHSYQQDLANHEHCTATPATIRLTRKTSTARPPRRWRANQEMAADTGRGARAGSGCPGVVLHICAFSVAAAEVTGHQPGADAEDGADRGGHHADEQRDAGTVEEPDEQVAARAHGRQSQPWMSVEKLAVPAVALCTRLLAYRATWDETSGTMAALFITTVFA
jgi:hypothetical protein